MAAERYDQAFFLSLAARGRDAWNAWRCDPANRAVGVTFAGVDFSHAPGDAVDFSGFQFGDGADFSGCTWRGHKKDNPAPFSRGSACFSGAGFGGFATFAGAAFGTFADFADATFGDNVSFIGCIFGQGANFSRANFGHQASFEQATFGSTALFVRATFGRHANFARVTFEDYAKFIDAAFGDKAAFKRAVFGEGTEFYGAVFADHADFGIAHFKGSVSFTAPAQIMLPGDRTDSPENEAESGEALSPQREEVSGPRRFLNISFANARFDGLADFSGRSFEGTADFSRARLSRRLNFDAAIDPARIDVTGAHIGFAQPGSLLHWVRTTLSGLTSAFLKKSAKR